MHNSIELFDGRKGKLTGGGFGGGPIGNFIGSKVRRPLGSQFARAAWGWERGWDTHPR